MGMFELVDSILDRFFCPYFSSILLRMFNNAILHTFRLNLIFLSFFIVQHSESLLRNKRLWSLDFRKKVLENNVCVPGVLLKSHNNLDKCCLVKLYAHELEGKTRHQTCV